MSTRVLIVDDSFFMRRSLERIFSHDPEIEVVGMAQNGKEALDKITPDVDVVTLDILMPVMDGLAALKEIRNRGMRARVIMVSALTAEGATATIQALRLGAEDFILKPQDSISSIPEEFSRELVAKVKALKFHVRKQPQAPPKPAGPASPAQNHLLEKKLQSNRIEIVLIGSSTGGPAALRAIFSRLTESLAVPVVIAQHMPALFTAHLAKDLSTAGKIQIMEAEDQLHLKPGMAVMAPGGKNLEVKKGSRGYTCHVVPASTNPAVPSPSVNALFSSLANAGGGVLAVILTGLGSDGADGMVQLRKAGAITIAQDETTSLIYGMPRSAIERGGVDEIVGLADIPDRIVKYVMNGRRDPSCSL